MRAPSLDPPLHPMIITVMFGSIWQSDFRRKVSVYKFGDHVGRILLTELEITDTADTTASPSYVSIHLETNSDGQLRT